MYLIQIYRGKGPVLNRKLSRSRNAVKHLVENNAQSVEVYDCNGWLLSRAERDNKGNPSRPKLFLDGEPRKYYKEMYKELLCT